MCCLALPYVQDVWCCKSTGVGKHVSKRIRTRYSVPFNYRLCLSGRLTSFRHSFLRQFLSLAHETRVEAHAGLYLPFCATRLPVFPPTSTVSPKYMYYIDTQAFPNPALLYSSAPHSQSTPEPSKVCGKICVSRGGVTGLTDSRTALLWPSCSIAFLYSLQAGNDQCYAVIEVGYLPFSEKRRSQHLSYIAVVPYSSHKASG